MEKTPMKTSTLETRRAREQTTSTSANQPTYLHRRQHLIFFDAATLASPPAPSNTHKPAKRVSPSPNGSDRRSGAPLAQSGFSDTDCKYTVKGLHML
ncbi:hypothetical protein HO173_003195 [Letharia columbiana]|uniref:Uncharacterized protein n=1 Tax=Letharia columbiana TaxID=112416 RepID=A0A8H6G1B3_9LECA|nr:uncharacterized protein HO173_003195 [Letharia columbiana]KAF6238689.1 hypothetical protein HO173_003195 [Letharia columbiana]